jgi:RNA-binding protein Musashi
MGDYYGNGGTTGGGRSSSSSGGAAAASSSGTGQHAPSAPGSSLQHSDSCKIFVGGLSWQTTEESLRWSFEQYGPVVSVEVMRDRNTGDPRGFAFVVFQDQATVDLVMQDKGKISVNHKLVDVKRAQARGVAPPSIHSDKTAAATTTTTTTAPITSNTPRVSLPSTVVPANMEPEPSPEQLGAKVFVGGLPPQVDNTELKTIFEAFGTVADAIVMVDQVTQRSRCFGFVTFGGEDGPAAAQRSIAAQPLAVYGRHVEVKLATPRAEQTGNANFKRGPPPGPKSVGLRAGQSSLVSSGEFAGLAVEYGRHGWKAGYGSKAFGKSGWAVQGWEDIGALPPEQAGFSFRLLRTVETNEQPPAKKARH